MLHAQDLKHANNFDFLRFVASSLVLFSHCYPLTGRNPEEPVRLLTHLENAGGFAVATFFVLSGYLVTGSLQHSRSALDYLLKRLLRLLPALATSVFLSALLLGPIFTTLTLTEYFSDPLFWHYFTNLYLLVNYKLPGIFASNAHPFAVNGSMWTLPIEFLMYVALLFLGVFGILKRRVVGCAIVACWGLKFLVLPAFDLEEVTIFYVIVAQDAAKLGALFLSGSLLWLVKDKFQPKWALILAMILMLFGVTSTIYATAGFMLAMPLIVIWLGHLPLNALQRFGKFGDFSYGIYIYAFPIQQIIVDQLGNQLNPLLLFILSFPPTLLLSAISWHLIEHPALELKKRFIRSKVA